MALREFDHVGLPHELLQNIALSAIEFRRLTQFFDNLLGGFIGCVELEPAFEVGAKDQREFSIEGFALVLFQQALFHEGLKSVQCGDMRGNRRSHRNQGVSAFPKPGGDQAD